MNAFTITIATRSRPNELAETLATLKRILPSGHLLIMDDASDVPIAPVVQAYYPQAVYRRSERNAGQCQRRSESFEIITTDYILQLDDDAAPIEKGRVEEAIDFLNANPRVGALSFHVFNGPVFPKDGLPPAEPKYAASFVGCAVMFRRSALQDSGGYISFFENEWEEEELSLRLLKAGWALYFYAPLLVHHKVTLTNRRTPRTWMRGLRNKLWAHLMHLPAHRLPLEMGWTLTIGLLDAVRLLRFHRFFQALALFTLGIPRALKLRRPMDALALRRFDALRFRGIHTQSDFDNPPAIGWLDLKNWFSRWRKRPRQRSVWDRRPGDTGQCETVKFAHEYPRNEPDNQSR